jgi:hypothetical protein
MPHSTLPRYRARWSRALAGHDELAFQCPGPIYSAMAVVKACLLLFLAFYVVPICIAAVLYVVDDTGDGWRTADRSSAGLLPPADRSPQAVVRIFSARTVRWRGIFATHCWIVFKAAGDTAYTRYDYTAWGDPIRLNGFEPDGRWFGHLPEVVFAADNAQAAAMIPRIQEVIGTYARRGEGDCRAWPGPNSNTFVTAIMDAMPGIDSALPPTAIGKDYPYDGRWARLTPSGTGVRLTLGGYAGVTVGWVEGLEIDILGAVAGVVIRHPAIKLPGIGRIGVPAARRGGDFAPAAAERPT